MGLIHKSRDLVTSSPQAIQKSKIDDSRRHLLIDYVTMFYVFRSADI